MDIGEGNPKGILDARLSRRNLLKGAVAIGMSSVAKRLPGSLAALEGLANIAPVEAQTERSRPREIGKGEVQISVAYADKTNFDDPEVKARIDEDIVFIKDVVSRLPIIGYPLIAISAQGRYKYDFPAVTPGQLGVYQKFMNYFFLNMEETDPLTRRYLLNHEMGGHYLSTNKNAENLRGYIDEESAQLAKQAEIDLLNQIRRYEEKYEKREAERPDLVVDQKLRDGIPVTIEEIIEAANVYPSDLFHHPEEYIQFRSADRIDPGEVRQRAESELYGEFTGFLLTAQQLGLFDPNYQHPVHAVFRQVKQAAE